MKDITKIDIIYEDTDAGGIVYYANYLKYFERARTNFFKNLNLNPFELAKNGLIFVVVNAEISYKYPARLGESIIIETTISSLKAAKIIFDYQIFSLDRKTLLVKGSTGLGSVDKNMKPQRISKEVRQIIEPITEPACQKPA